MQPEAFKETGDGRACWAADRSLEDENIGVRMNAVDAEEALANRDIGWYILISATFAELNNILNKKYADYGGLEQPGTNFNAGIQLSVF